MINCLFCDIHHCEWWGVDRYMESCPYSPDEEPDEDELRNMREYEDEQMQAEEEEHARNRVALSLICAHYDRDEARFREVSERLAADFDRDGRGELASFIRAQTGSEPSWVPMDQEDKSCVD